MLLNVHAMWNTENHMCLEKNVYADGANNNAVNNTVNDDDAVDKHCIAHLWYNIVGNCTCYKASGHSNGKAKAATEENQMLTSNPLANQPATESSNIHNKWRLEVAPVNKNNQTAAVSGETGSNKIYICQWWASKIAWLMRLHTLPSWWWQLNIIAAIMGMIFRVFL